MGVGWATIKNLELEVLVSKLPMVHLGQIQNLFACLFLLVFWQDSTCVWYDVMFWLLEVLC